MQTLGKIFRKFEQRGQSNLPKHRYSHFFFFSKFPPPDLKLKGSQLGNLTVIVFSGNLSQNIFCSLGEQIPGTQHSQVKGPSHSIVGTFAYFLPSEPAIFKLVDQQLFIDKIDVEHFSNNDDFRAFKQKFYIKINIHLENARPMLFQVFLVQSVYSRNDHLGLDLRI